MGKQKKPQKISVLPIEEHARLPQELQHVLIHQSRIQLNVPPPEILAAYQRLNPDAPQQFFRWAEEEMQHRRALDKKRVYGAVLDGHLGLIFGILAVLAVCGVAVVALTYGHPVTATILGGSTLAALAGVFIYGSSRLARVRHNGPQQEKNRD